MNQKCPVPLALAAALSLVGCSSGATRYTHPNLDLAAIKRVAVMPFENLTPERTAGEKVQKVFLTEVLANGLFEVAEPGLVAKSLRAENIQGAEALGPTDLKRIGETLKVDALFLGTVVDFKEGRSGAASIPEVTLQLRMVEVASGATIWSSSRTRSGTSASARLFGIGGQSLTEAARGVIREELASLE